jgi:hypothetical protein
MASALIHISVAKKINEKLHLNEKELYLSVIAPDISKLVGQTKEISHFQQSSYGDDPILERFLLKYKNELDNPFVLGYYIHLYTDKLWFNEFFNKLISGTYVHLNNGTDVRLERDEWHKVLYQDYTNLNVTLIENYNLDLSLFYEDMILPKTTIDEIPIDKLNLIIDKVSVIIKNSTYDKSYILNCNDIIKFIDETSDIIYEDIKKLLNNI